MSTRHVAACGLASLGLLHSIGVSAADTSWTAGAGPSQSFWDLATNWSAGLPLSATTRALLGAFDTTLRSGTFDVETVHGTGTLVVSGGSLGIAGSGSTLGRLDISGGSVAGAGDLTVSSLLVAGGARVGLATLNVNGLATISGPATIAGVVNATGFTLMGSIRGEPGSALSAGDTLQVGPGVELRGIDSVFASGAVVNDGLVVKSGSGSGSFGTFHAFENNGRIVVQGGSMNLSSGVGGLWTNRGSIVLEGGSTVISLFRGGGNMTQAGTIDVRGGSLRVESQWTELVSTGHWSVAEGARVELLGSCCDDFGRDRPLHFDAGSFYNAGHLTIRGGPVGFARGTLQGPGSIEVLDGGSMGIPDGASIGALRVAGSTDVNGFPYYSSVGTSALTVGRLEWADALLWLSGPLVVNGLATLTKNTYDFSPYPPGGKPEMGKQINVPVAFNGGVSWDGEADIHGTGTVSVAAGTTFEDRTARSVLATDPDTGAQGAGPIRIDLAGFDNAGTYLKNGAGPTLVVGPFRNTGTVKAIDAGLLTFAGPMDNRGTLEAVRSRVVVFGPLAQADGSTLTSGSYVVRDGTLVLNLGADLGGTRAALVRLNEADITLDGPQARLRTTWQGTEFDALSELAINRGRLALANGAALELAALRNSGVLEIDGARLAVARYEQDAAGAATWIDGVLESAYAGFLVGTLGVDPTDAIGAAHLAVGTLQFGSELRVDLDIARASMHDVIDVTGKARLDGVLVVDFAGGAASAGTYRVLVADGGVSGSFGTLQSNLDPARYRVDAVYGATYVDLNVTAVPEPASVVLMIGGLVGLGLRARVTRVEGDTFVNLSVSAVPEPDTAALCALGIAAIGAALKRRAHISRCSPALSPPSVT